MYKTLFTTTALLLSHFFVTAVAQNNTSCTATGTQVEVEGFVMDNFCIERGTLLDNQDVETLRNPEKHTIHCLVDISVCVESNYVVLERADGAELYSIKYQLGAEGSQLAKTEAERVRTAGEGDVGFNAKFSGVDDGTTELKCVQLVQSLQMTLPSDSGSPASAVPFVGLLIPIVVAVFTVVMPNL